MDERPQTDHRVTTLPPVNYLATLNPGYLNILLLQNAMTVLALDRTWANRGTDSRFELELIIFTQEAKTSRVNVEMIRHDFSQFKSARRGE